MTEFGKPLVDPGTPVEDVPKTAAEPAPTPSVTVAEAAAAWIQGCEKIGSAQVCTCAWRRIASRYSLPAFLAAAQRLDVGVTSGPVDECIRDLAL
jgi:hypothetical protein